MNQDTAHHMTTMMGDQNAADFVPSMDDMVEAYESAISYDEVFPALPDKEVQQPESQSANLGQWNQRMKMKSSVITQVFRVPVEERRFHELNNQRFGEQGEQAKICADIIRDTSAHIEISSSKDQSLTIVVTGKEEAVLKARREIIAKLQTQASIKIHIPKEHHRFILGKSGKKLQELELNTATRISVPRTEKNLDEIEITGSKEGIDKARHEIQLISDEQAKLAFERLNIPKIYHPFINGPYGQYATDLANETGARINIPPQSVQKDELTVAGEKEAVAIAKERILAIYEEKKRKCQTVSVEVKKAQHKYVIGPRGQTIQDILNDTGVSVEIPAADNPSGTITLRGDEANLGPALSKVYAMANSQKVEEVDAPSWLHKYIIGRQGAAIKQITQGLDKVHVEFTDGQDKIKVEGPHSEVDQACHLLKVQTQNLLSKFSFDEIKVDPKYHRFIIGKNGANVNKLKQDLGVQIQIPLESETIRIVGSPESVAEAKKELMEMVARMENEVSRDLIIEQRFHRTIIGTKGEKIKEIRDKCNQVNITFPEQGVKSDKVTVRGPKNDVEICSKELGKLHKELVANNYKAEVPIYKQLHKFVIGKGGANIKKIKEETDTKIDLPAEGSDSDVIIILGRKENVEMARKKIMEIQDSLANVVEADINIPAKIHNSIIGAKGHLIRSIKEECGGVTIHFPTEGSGSDKVTIRGPTEDVEKAKKQLLELSNEKQLAGYTEEIKAKREHHKFLIGKNGGNIKKVRDKTGARIIFPTDKDDDPTAIIIIGHKDAVLQAKVELAQMISELDKLTEGTTHVEPRHHRYFVARRGGVLQQISDDFGGVTITFPRNGENSDLVTLKGSKDCVEGAIAKILDIVNELDSRVTIDCIIPQKHHRTVMGAKGCRVQGISTDHNVQIKFPDREVREVTEATEEIENGEEPIINGEPEPIDSDEPKKTDIITITGQTDNCEAAKQALLAFVPITIEVTVPFDLHRYIIGQKGKGVRSMMESFEVNVTVPPAASQSDIIKIHGPPANVEDAKASLLEKVQQLEEEREDRALRSFKLTLEVDPKYHPKIIGSKGAVVRKIREDHKVQIQFPERNEPNESIITITGYEKNTEEARDEILNIIKDLEGLHEVAITIDARVHSRLIGTRGRNIRRLMEDYNVEIKFPRSSDSEPDLVIVSGSEERVEEAVDYLKNMEEEYLQDISENVRTSSRSYHDDDNDNRPAAKAGFIVTGGPWEQRAPDTTSAEEFPSFGAVPDTPKSVAWGPRH